ncbi:hypothetical protein [Allomuricauda sp. d1]|uniref:hypothetical protein n=1 Tax=Allomuricauda sp. d1 TaxID=3136725 RepID=UPI0031D7961B
MDFYTNKLGFEVRTDASMDKFSWLTVGHEDQPEMELILMPILEQMHGGKKSADQLHNLVKRGAMGQTSI